MSMMVPGHRRLFFPDADARGLPVRLESIGYNPAQETFVRPEGYPAWHWLQTAEGEGGIAIGELRSGAQTVALPAGSGVLLPPHTPHRYGSVGSGNWGTYYLTFAGDAAANLLETLELGGIYICRWDKDSPLSGLLEDMLTRRERERDRDLFGLEASAAAYRFLLTLSRYGGTSERAALSSHAARLQPLLRWMEEEYGNPGVGLDDLAGVLGVSGRYLSRMFLQTFGLSPYAYFLRLRVRKSKELLLQRPGDTVTAVAARAGFRDVSHFVATFRRLTGTTPEQFRRLH
ncbi:AraC family transcriptional regulator [Paenibacillus glufosinatiresistens]|uniref:AraC family transcriptional regulator n=1 Tax=Paenibacillus glufosinatiresistens TaxID=3070657 RepID=UPI00286E917F|nr:AraC family transcriptional regulator [Paenibacillus sp. YX.27]